MRRNNEIYKKFKSYKCCVLVPTFNNYKTLGRVIDGILKFTDQIIILNDGSTDKTADLLQKYLSLEIINFKKNRGKGFVLKAGLKLALQKGFDYAITIDSDGQHFPSDLPIFIKQLEKAPGAVIIGARNMKQKFVPGKSSFGNKFSNFWFKFETGISLPDTQSGYRLYPVKLIKDIKFYSRKYEFEIEILVRAAWKGVKLLSIPVNIKYFPKEERISHFRPIRDFLRVTGLNIIFVVISLLYVKPLNILKDLKKNFKKSKESNFKLTCAVVIGVFMGIAPVWGYQLVLALLLAILFRLNKLIVAAATNISLPPFIPIIIYSSFKLGAFFVENSNKVTYNQNINLEIIKNNLFQYIIGSIFLGIILSFILGIITYFSLLFFRRKRTW